MSLSLIIKGRAADEVFQEQCLLWERGASIDLFKFQHLLHAQEYNTLRERGKKQKSTKSLLK